MKRLHKDDGLRCISDGCRFCNRLSMDGAFGCTKINREFSDAEGNVETPPTWCPLGQSIKRPNPPKKRPPVVMIDCTPTWTGVLPVLVELLTNSTEVGRKTATEELQKMARAADEYNKLHAK